jgi:hypothetical protein
MDLSNAKVPKLSESGSTRRIGMLRILTGSLLAASVTVISMPVRSQGVYFYPSQGQSQEQQERDRFSCHQWAVQQTGFDPTRAPAASAAQSAPPPPPPSQAPQSGQVVRGAGRGAAVGAVGGAIGGDAGKGAAIGAATGALVGGFRRRDQARQEAAQQQAYQQQFAAAQSQQAATAASQYGAYNRALGACMQGRGYAVN